MTLSLMWIDILAFVFELVNLMHSYEAHWHLCHLMPNLKVHQLKYRGLLLLFSLDSPCLYCFVAPYIYFGKFPMYAHLQRLIINALFDAWFWCLSTNVGKLILMSIYKCGKIDIGAYLRMKENLHWCLSTNVGKFKLVYIYDCGRLLPIYNCGKIEIGAYFHLWEHCDWCLFTNVVKYRLMPI